MSKRQAKTWIDLIEAERARQGMTKTALAEAAGISQGKTSNILNHNAPGVSAINLQRLAEALGMKLVATKR